MRKLSIAPKPVSAELSALKVETLPPKLSIVPEFPISKSSTVPDVGSRSPILRTVAPGTYSVSAGRQIPFRQSAPIVRERGEGFGEAQFLFKVEEIGYHMYYGGSGAYLYQPIPKCACTTIKTLLLELEGREVDENVWRRHQKEFNGFPGTNRLPLQEQLDIFEGRTNTFKFVIVRNPYARLASAYSDKVLLRPAPYMIRKIKKAAADQGAVVSDPITFEEFVAVVSRQTPEEMDTHYRPQYYEGRFPIVKYDFIGRMEAMPDDLVFVLERIGAPESIIARAHERYNFAGSSLDLWESVSSEVQRQVRATFEIDFDTLQYPTRLPRTPSPEYA
jgi:hypothetical protein